MLGHSWTHEESSSLSVWPGNPSHLMPGDVCAIVDCSVSLRTLNVHDTDPVAPPTRASCFLAYSCFHVAFVSSNATSFIKLHGAIYLSFPWVPMILILYVL